MDRLEQDYVSMINEALSERPVDMTVAMHICRGNFRSTWFSSGDYEPVVEILFGNTKVDGFSLEYDSDRAGDFSPLSRLTVQEVKAVGRELGLPSMFVDKTPIDGLQPKTDEENLPVNQLCLSPQCGFASTEEGNLLTEEEQGTKIAFIKEIAESIWK